MVHLEVRGIEVGQVEGPRRVGPVVGVGVRQRHVAHAQSVELPQGAERVLDGVAALDPHQHGDAAVALGLPDLSHGRRGHQAIGMRPHDTLHQVDEIQRLARRAARLGVALRYVDGEERRRQTALQGARDVEMLRRPAAADVGPFFLQRIRRVDVCVDHDGALVEATRLRFEIGGRGGKRRGGDEDHGPCERASHPALRKMASERRFSHRCRPARRFTGWFAALTGPARLR